MLLNGSRLIDVPVMGLQTGSELARTAKPVIDPATLEIVAYELSGPLLNTRPSLLRVSDVREFSDIGLIVDSSDEFVDTREIIKLKDIYERHFKLIGFNVTNERRRKIGKINGYTLDTNDFLIQQINVKRTILRSLGDTELLIHRSQITEINDKAIVISEAQVTGDEPIIQSVDNYANPFRKIRPQAEHNIE